MRIYRTSVYLPKDALQVAVLQFAKEAETHPLLKDILTNFNYAAPYIGLGVVAKRLLNPCDVDWSRVLILYVFISKLASKHVLDTGLVASVIWSRGIESYLQNYRWSNTVDFSTRSSFTFPRAMSGIFIFLCLGINLYYCL